MEELMNLQQNENQETNLIPVEKRTEMYLTDIRKANLLTPAMLNKITELGPELTHVFRTQTIWRSETEIRCSVLNDLSFPDAASKYHQAKLEQMVFAEQLLHLTFDFRKLQQDLTMKEAEIEELEDKLMSPDLKSWEVKKLEAEKEKKNIEREEMLYGVENMQIQARERMREVEIWSRVKAELDDGSFDKDSKDVNQLTSLTRRYVQEASNAVHNGKNSDISSYNNIVGQFQMLVKTCYVRGILEDVLAIFGNQDLINWVYGSCGLTRPAPQQQQQTMFNPNINAQGTPGW